MKQLILIIALCVLTGCGNTNPNAPEPDDWKYISKTMPDKDGVVCYFYGSGNGSGSISCVKVQNESKN